jgi:hypothetical protein
MLKLKLPLLINTLLLNRLLLNRLRPPVHLTLTQELPTGSMPCKDVVHLPQPLKQFDGLMTMPMPKL